MTLEPELLKPFFSKDKKWFLSFTFLLQCEDRNLSRPVLVTYPVGFVGFLAPPAGRYPSMQRWTFIHTSLLHY